jgi:uncharacterized protein YbaR (Trm112 family)
MDPTRTTRLEVERDWLVCQQCAVRFPVKDGLPILMIDDAELPANCPSVNDLPCQRKAQLAPSGTT